MEYAQLCEQAALNKSWLKFGTEKTPERERMAFFDGHNAGWKNAIQYKEDHRQSLDSTGTALVRKDWHYQPITPETPRGKVMLLINKEAKRAQVGVLLPGDTHWTHFAPLPTFEDW